MCVVYRRTSACGWVGVFLLVLQWMKNIHKIWSDISFWLGNVGVWFKSSKSSLPVKHNTHCSLPLLIKTGLAQVKHPILRTLIGPLFFLWKYEIPRVISCHKRKWLSRDLNWVSLILCLLFKNYIISLNFWPPSSFYLLQFSRFTHHKQLRWKSMPYMLP